MARWRTRVAQSRLAITNPRESRLHRKYRSYSMQSMARFVENLVVAERAAPGAIVECGTWRGGMSAALAEKLPGRRSMLFDSFEGLPAPIERDGDEARALMVRDPLVASEEAARDAMRMSGSSDYEIVRGWFEETVPPFAATRPVIGLLRVDGDWYESTMTCLTELFPLVPERGLVIIDDYTDWEGCTRAVHDYFSANDRPEPIRQSRYGVPYVVKSAP